MDPNYRRLVLELLIIVGFMAAGFYAFSALAQ